jgi:hypothetical protein
VYQQAMPGYEIFGIIGLGGGNGWVSTDALHCRTHEVADKGMLYIHHLPVLDAQPVQTQYMINADIYALSDSSLIADSMWIKYKVNNGAWAQVLMTNPSGNQWQAAIPQQPIGDTVRYYIHASDHSPRSQTHPLIGSYDPHKFWVTGSVSVEEKKTAAALVFPNPANEDVFVQMKDCSSPDVSVKLFDIVGNEVISFTEKNSCDKMFRLNVKDIPQGTYFLQLHSGENFVTRKIMVMH